MFSYSIDLRIVFWISNFSKKYRLEVEMSSRMSFLVFSFSVFILWESFMDVIFILFLRLDMENIYIYLLGICLRWIFWAFLFSC